MSPDSYYVLFSQGGAAALPAVYFVVTGLLTAAVLLCVSLVVFRGGRESAPAPAGETSEQRARRERRALARIERQLRAEAPRFARQIEAFNLAQAREHSRF